jgi:hypothetical protein
MTRRGIHANDRHRLRRLAAVGLCVAAAMSSGAVAQAVSAATPPADTTGCPAYNAPNTLTLASGTPQSAKLGTPFADPLQVTLANTNGCPITTPLAGIAVTFAAPGSGPSGTFSASGSNAVLVGTNAAGSATASQLTANTVAGGYQVVASSDYGSVSFSLVNTASGVPATIAPLAVSSQSASVSTRYAQPLRAQVRDANGNPVTGADVTFSLGSGGGGGAGGSGSGAGSAGASFAGGQTQASALTDSSGIATSPMFTANSLAGKFTAAATTTGISEAASFQLHNLAGKPPLLEPVGKRKLSATVGTRYGRALHAKLTDATGAPLEGMSVTFNLGSGSGGGAGASGSGAGSAGATFPGGSTQATETTDATGVATSPRFDANTTAGTFTATAAVPGVTNPAEFTLDNLAGKPPAIKTLGPAKRSATVDSHYSRPLEVKLTDRKGKPLQGESVTFTLGSSAGGGGAGAGGSGAGSAGASFVGGSAQATETTNASGVAISPRFEANTTAGTFTATAAATGTGATASIQLDNLAGAADAVAVGAAATETTSVGSRFPIPLAVTVTDKYGNPVAGALVSFTSPTGGPSGTFSRSGHRHPHAVHVRTNASGIAVAPAFTANAVTGGYIVKAAVRGAAPAAFALVNQPPGL